MHDPDALHVAAATASATKSRSAAFRLRAIQAVQIDFGIDGIVTAPQLDQHFFGNMRPAEQQFIAGAEQRFVRRGQQAFPEHFAAGRAA